MRKQLLKKEQKKPQRTTLPSGVIVTKSTARTDSYFLGRKLTRKPLMSKSVIDSNAFLQPGKIWLSAAYCRAADAFSKSACGNVAFNAFVAGGLVGLVEEVQYSLISGVPMLRCDGTICACLPTCHTVVVRLAETFATQR